jgi:O-acetyl-ADP-ribose deacetylase (regulator of RNase III)
MPYGRSGERGPDGLKDERTHFDDVYEFICETVEALRIKPLRSDRTPEAVPIHSKMLTDIIDADLAIVDITDRNPNVFYELGVRHTARRNSTLLIGYGDTLPPFNLSGIRVISYDLGTPESREASRQKLHDAIIANLSSRVTDSLVHSLLPGLNLSRPQQPLRQVREAIEVTFSPPARPNTSTGRGAAPAPRSFTLGVIKGDLIDVDIVDVWVNPESTRMEMARIHDDSVSAFIRYHGAKKDLQGNVTRDKVYDELRKTVGTSNVEAGWVIVTGPGDLASVNVRALFHVAAQHGEPCSGYRTIKTYTSVIANALEKMDELNDKWWRRWRILGISRPLTSIVFPLLGTRAQELDAIEVTVGLVREARKYLTLWPDTQIKSVYFLAYTKRDLELCEAAFQRLGMPLPTST